MGILKSVFGNKAAMDAAKGVGKFIDEQQLTDEEKAELRGIQYRIGSKDGSQMYLKFKILLLTSGLDRGVQDWASSTAEKLELEGARLKRYTDGNLYLEAAGLSTPIAVPNYYVQRDRHIKQIIKELRAEQD